MKNIKNLLPWILLTTLVAGSLDILSAFADYYITTHKGPEGILRYIASSVWGSARAKEGNDMLVYGLLLHYVIAFLFTSFYFWLYPRIKFMREYALLSGFLFGIFVWVVMNLIVVPLTLIPHRSFTLQKIVKSSLILIFMIGIPIALLTKKAYSKRWMNR